MLRRSGVLGRRGDRMAKRGSEGKRVKQVPATQRGGANLLLTWRSVSDGSTCVSEGVASCRYYVVFPRRRPASVSPSVPPASSVAVGLLVSRVGLRGQRVDPVALEGISAARVSVLSMPSAGARRRTNASKCNTTATTTISQTRGNSHGTVWAAILAPKRAVVRGAPAMAQGTDASPGTCGTLPRGSMALPNARGGQRYAAGEGGTHCHVACGSPLLARSSCRTIPHASPCDLRTDGGVRGADGELLRE